MFEIGFWELGLLFVLGLVVLGPEKLPRVAAQLGRYAGQARRMARTFTAQIRDELEAEERRISASESTASSSQSTATVSPAGTSATAAENPSPESSTAPDGRFSRPGADDLIPRDASTTEPPARNAGTGDGPATADLFDTSGASSGDVAESPAKRPQSALKPV